MFFIDLYVADMGPAYRNVIGIPGGIHSPLFKILQEWALL